MKNEIKLELEKYVNAFEYYSDHHKSQELALKLQPKIDNYREFLDRTHGLGRKETEYLDEALKCVVDCHRILKNTYVFDYFMKENNKKLLFKQHQTIYDQQADSLHEKLEKDELPSIISIDNKEDFDNAYVKYKNKVVNIMSAIEKYRNSVLECIENELINYLDYSLLKKSSSQF